MAVPHRRQLKHYNDQGHAHFITFSCWKRLPLLSKDRSRLWFLRSLNTSLTKHDYGCWAFVIMPEHVHLMVSPHASVYNTGAFLASLKLCVTRAAVKYLQQHTPKFLETLLDVQPSGRRSYRFWRPGGGIDVNLWTDAKIWDKIDYCHNNPLRRGLTERPEDWKWSSYRDYAASRTVGPVPIDWETPPNDLRRDS
jgi:putative transposase